MMLVKDAENAQGSDPAPFFPTAGTNVDAKAQQKLSKEAQKLIKEKVHLLTLKEENQSQSELKVLRAELKRN